MKLKSPFSSDGFRGISICALMVLFFIGFPTYSNCEDKHQFSPYIESFSDGWIDWDNGLVYGVGKGYLRLNQNSKNKSLRAAQVMALQAILKVAARIRLDDRQTLESLEKNKGVIQLKAFIRSTEHQMVFESNDNQPHFSVTFKAPLTGIEGLTVRLLNRLRKRPSRWQDFPKPPDKSDVEDIDAPWLILDARRLMAQNKVKPALFPKIISTSGKTIYELKKVDEDALINRGMARYVLSDMTREQLRSKENQIDDMLAKVLQLLSVREAYADEERKKRKRRKFIVKEVKYAQGLMKTNLIISEKDARNLSGADASSRILKKCRVIILISSPVGGIEGSLPRYLALSD